MTITLCSIHAQTDSFNPKIHEYDIMTQATSDISDIFLR